MRKSPLPLIFVLGPFVVRAFLRSSTSEGLLLKTDSLLPKEAKTTEAETEETQTAEAA